MNRQNFIEKFAKSKRPKNSPKSPITLDVDFWFKNQMVFCHDDFSLDFCASYWPAALWTEEAHPEQKIMVATHRQDHAQHLLHQTIGYLSEFDSDLDPLLRNQREITNEQGGSLYFCTIGSSIAGRRFDQIVINDMFNPARTPGHEASYREWLEQIPCRLSPG